MPIRTQNDLPAKRRLERENIFVVDEDRALHQDIRPIEICILNLMPLKEDTELDILRSMSNTPLQVNVTFLTTASHRASHVSRSHLNNFYLHFDDIKEENFDGFLITGAPVEMKAFENVDYWKELCTIMEWTKTHVTSTLHVCWGAQAGAYYHYGIKKYELSEKLSGVYPQRVENRKIPLVRGFDDFFMAPVSRWTECHSDEIRACKDLVVVSDSPEAGILLCMTNDGKQIFDFGHLEYDRMTLDREYKRDLKKGMRPQIPVNYYPADDPTKRPLLQWRSHANALYSNWLNYYVYQMTPYNFIDANRVIVQTSQALTDLIKEE